VAEVKKLQKRSKKIKKFVIKEGKYP